MGAIAMRIRARRARPAAQQMLDLIRRQGSGGAAFLPGVPLASGAHWLSVASSSPTPGFLGLDGVTRPTIPWLAAYVESTASTPAAVDGPVGFLSDGEGTVGAELLGNTGGPFSSTAWWNTAGTGGNAAMTIVGSELQLTSSSASSSNRVEHPVSGLTVGKTYRVTATARLGTAASGLIHVVGDASVGYAQPSIDMNIVGATSGFYTFTFVANSPSCYLQFVTQGVGTLLVGSASLRQLNGRHATQNSGPNKPTMRRGVTNLLTYSNDLTNGVWGQQGGATQSGGVMSFPTIGMQWLHNPVLPAAVPFTWAPILSGSGTCSIFSYNTTDGNIGVKQITLTPTPTIYVSNASPTNATTYHYVARVAGDTATSVTFGGAGLFLGTLTASQIQAAGGIPLTTTIAASSSGGNYALEFDGTKQMGLSSVPFAASDDHAVVVGARVEDVAGSRTLYAHSNASNHQLPWLYFNTAGKIVATWGDGTTYVTLTSPLSYTGQDVVVSIRRLGSAAVLRVNGQQVATASLAGMTSPALTTATLGGFNGSNLQHKGRIFGALPFKGTFTDAEVLVLERGLAALCPIPGALRF